MMSEKKKKIYENFIKYIRFQFEWKDLKYSGGDAEKKEIKKTL